MIYLSARKLYINSRLVWYDKVRMMLYAPHPPSPQTVIDMRLSSLMPAITVALYDVEEAKELCTNDGDLVEEFGCGGFR